MSLMFSPGSWWFYGGFLLASLSFWVLLLSFCIVLYSVSIFLWGSLGFCVLGCDWAVSDLFLFLSHSCAAIFFAFLELRWLLFLVLVLCFVPVVFIGPCCCSGSRPVLGSWGSEWWVFCGSSLGFYLRFFITLTAVGKFGIRFHNFPNCFLWCVHLFIVQVRVVCLVIHVLSGSIVLCGSIFVGENGGCWFVFVYVRQFFLLPTVFPLQKSHR